MGVVLYHIKAFKPHPLPHQSDLSTKGVGTTRCLRYTTAAHGKAQPGRLRSVWRHTLTTELTQRITLTTTASYVCLIRARSGV